MWTLDLEDYFYRVYDSHKQVAGYFDPDYGKIGQQPEAELEQIEEMHKRSACISGGFLTLPMVKFGVFAEKSLQADVLKERVGQALERISYWGEFLSGFGHAHWVSVSHTDQDMLSITVEIRFGGPVPLDKRMLQERLAPVLDRMQSLGLL